jgi:hypothetical protein
MDIVDSIPCYVFISQPQLGEFGVPWPGNIDQGAEEGKIDDTLEA